MANKYWWGGDTNHAGDFTWDNTKQDTIDNAAAVDKTGGLVGIPITGTIFAAGDSIIIADTTNYNGTYTVESATTDEVVITETYAAETFAGTETATNARSNWRLVSDGADTEKPADADIVFLDNRAALNTTTNKRQSLNVNVSSAFTGTPDLAGFYRSPNFDGNIGKDTEYLEIQADGDDIILQGAGTTYLKLSAGVDTDANAGRLVVDNPAGIVYLASLENDGTYVGLFTLILVRAGTLYIDDDCAVGSVYCLGTSAVVVAGTGVTNAKNATNATIMQIDGKITWSSPFASLNSYGGSFYWGADDMVPMAGMDADMITTYSTGSRVYWQASDTAKSILKRFIAYAGLIDAGRAAGAGYAKEIGSGTEVSEVWPDAVVNLNNNNRNVTIAAGSVIESFGGKLTPPAGSSIDW